jgi:hypothetical protein
MEATMIRRITFVALPFVISGSIAHAVTLSTPNVAVGVAQTNLCIVTNVGTTPAEVSVELFSAGGFKVVPTNDNCGAFPTQDPHARCFVIAPQGEDVSCVIQSSSRNVRGALEVQDTSTNSASLVAVVPATAN